MTKVRLGVNIDHVATLREVRKGRYPDPLVAAKICEKSGADGIVCHLREDRRHIQEKDVARLLQNLRIPLNLEMSMAPDIVQIALRLRPQKVTLVPEKRQELTTEGGLDVIAHQKKLKKVVSAFQKKEIPVSFFIDPDAEQLHASWNLGTRFLEFHTGEYANAKNVLTRRRHLRRLQQVCREASVMGFEVAAGHGLHYENTKAVARIPEVEELNIGHAIVSQAVFVGLAKAVRDMKRLIR